MRTLFSSLIVATLLLGGSMDQGSAQGSKEKKDEAPKVHQLIVGLDLSASNPLVKDPGFAAKAGERIRPIIEKMPARSIVMVRTFGTYGVTSSNLRIDRVVSAKNRPEDVARLVSTVVSGIPKLVKDGKLKAHNQTNIIPFLETMNQVMDCRTRPTRIILLTDGVEDSVYARLDKISSKLPTPEKRDFRHCQELQMLGLGLNFRNPRMTTHLREEWKNWSKAAGFKKYVGLNDW